MNAYEIPLLPVSLAHHVDETMQNYDIEGIELEYPWAKYEPRTLFSGAFVAAGTDGLGVSFCAEVPHDKVTATHTAPKSPVADDDCVGIFLMPAATKADPALLDGAAPTYYCFEINPNGALLDYRACIAPEDDSAPTPAQSPAPQLTSTGRSELCCESVSGAPAPGAPVSGVLHTIVAETPLIFDYSYQSGAVVTTSIEDEFWYTELFIPWRALGRDAPPAPGETWRATINRIDRSGAAKRAGSKKSAPHPGYQTLITGTPWTQFHQPSFFATFTFKKAL